MIFEAFGIDTAIEPDVGVNGTVNDVARDVNEGMVTCSATMDDGKVTADAVTALEPLRRQGRAFKQGVINIQVEAAPAAGCRHENVRSNRNVDYA